MPVQEPVQAVVALDLATAQTYSENVFLFLPNIIGYVRIVLAGLSLHYMNYHPKYCTIAYGISCLLDAVDGPVARARNETSKFGAVLDMVTDRCTTSCLLCYLSSAYPRFALLFQFLITLDFSSHYMHMYSSLVTGSKSHKTVTNDFSRILRFYYHNRHILFIICFANELFFVALYLMKWVSTPIGGSVAAVIPFLAKYTWPEVAAAVCFPICFLKNIINIVQLWKASKTLVGVDLYERELARQEQKKREE
ncbi:phosphatidylinositol synthase [Flagelloscypha sp. PMI_526]|nr:phosphatidylinositol synthase [Flagelloscypha sp. PMI_526]